MPRLSDDVCRLRSPLGDGALYLERMQGHEAISRPYRFELDLLSHELNLDFEKIVGLPLGVELACAEGVRHFHGIVSRFSLEEAREEQVGREYEVAYQAELVPWFWLLTRTSNCRIFQHKSVPEIVSQVFEDLGFRDYELRLSGSYETREYCVQYRESDFDFVSRLLEDEGISYFFEHAVDSHKLVCFDASAANPLCPGLESARYDKQRDNEAIHGFTVARGVRTSTWSVRDFDFENPDLDLLASTPSSQPLGSNGRFETYDYPGCYVTLDQGDRRAKCRMEAEEAASFEIRGDSSCRALTSGYQFKLKDHFRDDWNASYVVTRVEHRVEHPDPKNPGETRPYANEFACIPAGVPYRELPRTKKPVISGVQTATVVGASGREIDIDKYGRVVVQFHWDREGQRDQNSSCRVRVAQNWAGNRWGAVFHPRIGQEVVVDFIEGDPDRPIITGRVYNAKLMPPYDLPANATQSGVKTRSSDDGDRRTFNEIRFEDKKGSEDLYIHAEKDENVVVENDKNEDVGHDETLVVANDRKRRVDHDETLRIGRNQELVVGRDQVVMVGDNASLNAGKQMRIVVGKSSITLHQNGTIIIDGVEVYVNGKELSLRGKDSLKYHSESILGLAYTEHTIRGARLKHNP